METPLIQAELSRRVLVLDGAMGTALQAISLTAHDFGGDALEGCNENLILTRPDVIRDIHRAYLKAGCDIVETNTFGATPLVLAEYDLADRAADINFEAARIAVKEAKEFSTSDKPRFVAGSIGPTTKAISVTGGVTFQELIDHFKIQAQALIEGGVDYLLLETCQDTRNIKAALVAIDALKTSIPVAVSGTIEASGTMLAGQTAEALYASLAHRDLLYLGLNCATGPDFMTDPIRSLAGMCRFPIACVPNAGLPDENGCYLESPEMLSRVLSRFLSAGWLNLIGGCCGTHAGHIEKLAECARSFAPRVANVQKRSMLSGVDYLEITDEMRPVLVGERTNVIGSRKFKRLICEEKFDEASDISRAQIKNGAQIIDACLANPDRDELSDMNRFLEIAIKKIRAPLMIDTTDAAVLRDALTYSQGKSIINSINLEDGEERFEQVIPLGRQFGAAFVVGTIDDHPEQGMGVTRHRKLEIARRSYRLLTEKYGVEPEDIYWDPLVFPCGTGDAQYVGSALETIEGIRLLKEAFPRTRTVLGISNVSFGLPEAGREVLNSVFLYHCVQAGLDLAIVNSEKLERIAKMGDEERRLSEDLLFNRGSDPVAAFAAFFREKKTATPGADRAKLPLDQRLSRYIVEGSKDGLHADLAEALKNQAPLEIVNGPLMRGMDEVGKLFNENKLIVAEVLQSAEAMKAAVSFLEPHMEKSESVSRGKVLLATVKGDVHDIGKNLVEIILANNGFEVINLGIKIPPEQLITAIKQHQPDIIGLSGLLVKSAQQMVLTAGDLSRAGTIPTMLVGGAALTENFVDRQIAPAYAGTVAYANDAMAGLDLAKTVVHKPSFEVLQTTMHERRQAKILEHQKLAAQKALLQAAEGPAKPEDPSLALRRSPSVEPIATPPKPSDLERHVLTQTPIEQIWKFINPLMLYGRHLGIRGQVVRQIEQSALSSSGSVSLQRELAEKEPKSLAIWLAVQEIKETYAGSDLFWPRGVYQFLPARSEGNTVFVRSPQGERSFVFPRQRLNDRLCLADYLSHSGDHLGLFVVTVGRGVREMAEALKNRGDYLKSHVIQALALESAEAYAEWMHSQMRKMWGFEDPPEMTMMQRFQAKYRGKRYSFGYPACPVLDDQSTLFELLKPEEMGVQLTEGFMMDPEASVSAIVFHHPQATYFSAGISGVNGEASSEQRQ